MKAVHNPMYLYFDKIHQKFHVMNPGDASMRVLLTAIRYMRIENEVSFF